MESDSRGSAPTPAEAREALSRLHSDDKKLAERLVTPWWYHPALGLIVALIAGSQALPSPASTAVLAVSIVAILVLIITYTRLYGVWTNRPMGPQSRRLLITMVLIVILAMVSNLVVKLADLTPLWVLLPAAVAFGTTVVIGPRYDAALRSELAAAPSAKA
ncbi:hypothetical protein [Paramicrobacterium fandaimingii]|uniref:hypothetical protein n=1 Tax=Paramicrobacterium fandaimingii TaxID=2708079 RepID=UPI00141E7981|nr:hypothetical protein [Microbacterium fandaimingii]